MMAISDGLELEPELEQIEVSPMKQPFKILIDIWGVITSWHFLNALNQYIRDNIFDYLEHHWDRPQMKDFLNELNEQTERDKEANPEIPSILSQNEDNKNEVILSVVENIKWRETHKLNTFSSIKKLYQSIWSEAYRTHRLLVHVFDDVVDAFTYWRSEDLGIKIYTFATGSPQMQKLFLSSTIVGDLSGHIANGLNSFREYKYDKNRFHQIFCALLERHPQNILYITDSPRKARAAIEAQFRAVVILRPGNREYTQKQLKGIPVIKTLKELEFIPA